MLSSDFSGELDIPHFTETGLIAQDILDISDLSYCVTGGDYYDSSGNLIIKVK